MKFLQMTAARRLEYRRAQWRAQQIANRAIKRGKIANLKEQVVKCVDCGMRATAYDHRDYAKPLRVSPVCHTCNVRRGPAILSRKVVLRKGHRRSPTNAEITALKEAFEKAWFGGEFDEVRRKMVE